MPFFYSVVIDSIHVDTVQIELREIADYVSSTFANLFFLVNSTSYDINVTKELIYLPSTVEESIYILKIEESEGKALKITAYLKYKPSVAAGAWLVPGLKIDAAARAHVESAARPVVAGCRRDGADVYIWIDYGDAG